MHRIALVASLLITILIIGNGITSNQSSTLAATLVAGNWTYRTKVAAAIVPIWAAACWPWFVSLLRSSNEERVVSAITFSTFALALAAYAHSAIASAPSEGVGVYVIVYYLAVWVVYFVTLLFRHK